MESMPEALTKNGSRVTFLGQAYLTHLREPYVIKRTDSTLAYFRHSRDRRYPCILLKTSLTRWTFCSRMKMYRTSSTSYWNDAINAMGYPAKLLAAFLLKMMVELPICPVLNFR